MTSKQLSTALRASYQALASSLGVDVAWPNIAYEPSGGVYTEFDIITSPDREWSVQGGLVRKMGIMQITVIAPKDTGTQIIDELLDKISDAYPYGSSIISGGEIIDIYQAPQFSPVMIDESGTRVAISVYYNVLS